MTTDGPASPPPAPAGASRSHRLRNLLIIVVGFFVTLGVVVGSAMYFFYDRAGGIDRSTPQVVTRQFLDATLVLEDPARTSLFVCSRWSTEDAIAEIGSTYADTSASWGALNAQVAGDNATVTARITFRFPDSRRQVEVWTLNLVNEDGWRVCGLTKDSSLDP